MSRHRNIGFAVGLATTLLTGAGSVPPVAAAASSGGAEVVEYTIDATLDPTTHRIEGSQSLRWRNRSDHPVTELRFHLYLNAFKSSTSAFLRDAPRREIQALSNHGWGWIDVHSIERVGGGDLLANAETIEPDEGGPSRERYDDHTVLRVPLDQPLPPGESLRLQIAFTSQLPRVIARTGFRGRFHLVAQWYPKLGVLGDDGAWRCNTFQPDSEFFGDFGTYDVRLSTPPDYRLGASGTLVSETLSDDESILTRRYRARRVHDFAWTAWTEFVEVRRTASLEGLPDVELILLLQPESVRHAPRYVTALERGLALFGAWYGPYPHPTLTVVDPPWNARAAGGMEYPGLITTGASRFSPPATLRPEGVTLHELAHQYFYGLVATDEAREPFLDEGLSTYAAGRALRRAYGEQAWSYRTWGIPWVFRSVRREPGVDTAGGYLRRPWVEPIARTSWGYRDQRSYATLAYGKMALAMEQAERTIGRETMERAMRAFVDRFRFRHPRARDLVETLSTTANRDLWPFFSQALYTASTLDYAVAKVTTRPARGPVGLSGTGDARVRIDSAERLPGFESEVLVQRIGGFRTPVTVELTFDQGEPARLVWDGEERWVRYRVRGPRLLAATVDPDRVLVLDANPLNDSLRIRPDRRASRKWSQRLRFWVQNILESVALWA